MTSRSSVYVIEFLATLYLLGRLPTALDDLAPEALDLIGLPCFGSYRPTLT